MRQQSQLMALCSSGVTTPTASWAQAIETREEVLQQLNISVNSKSPKSAADKTTLLLLRKITRFLSVENFLSQLTTQKMTKPSKLTASHRFNLSLNSSKASRSFKWRHLSSLQFQLNQETLKSPKSCFCGVRLLQDFFKSLLHLTSLQLNAKMDSRHRFSM